MILYHFEYVLDDKDYVAFSIHHMRNSQANKKSLLIIRLLILSIFFISFLRNFSHYTEHGILIMVAMLYVIFYVILWIAMKPLTEFILKVQIEMVKREGKLPYDRDITMEFYKDYFVEITNETENKTNYTKIEKIIIGDNAIYIFVSAMQSYIIPFSVFKSEKQRSKFEFFIKNKTKKLCP